MPKFEKIENTLCAKFDFLKRVLENCFKKKYDFLSHVSTKHDG